MAKGAKSGLQTPAELQRAVWEREMRRLQVVSRVLAAVLLALVARMLISGPDPLSGVTAVVIAGLLVAALSLRREGRRLLERERSDPPAREDSFTPPS